MQKVNQKLDGLVELCKKLAVKVEKEVVCVLMLFEPRSDDKM